jgi:cytochrome c-type biogenesis protein CcmH/NrfG
LALAFLAAFSGNALSAQNADPRAEVLQRLAPALATHDPLRVTLAYRAMGDYGLPAADIVEETVNAMGYRRLENNEVEEAFAAFELNIETFPWSANAWHSLAEAAIAVGKEALALRAYGISLEIDPENHNAALMIERIMGEPQPGQASSS